MEKQNIYIHINGRQNEYILMEIRVLIRCFKAFAREEWKDNYR